MDKVLFDEAIEAILAGAKKFIACIEDTNQFCPDDDSPLTKIPVEVFCLKLAHKVWQETRLPVNYFPAMLDEGCCGGHSEKQEGCCGGHSEKQEGCCGGHSMRKSVPHSEFEHLKFAFEQLLPEEAAGALKEMQEERGESGGVMAEALDQLDGSEREELMGILQRKATENQG